MRRLHIILLALSLMTFSATASGCGVIEGLLGGGEESAEGEEAEAEEAEGEEAMDEEGEGDEAMDEEGEEMAEGDEEDGEEMAEGDEADGEEMAEGDEEGEGDEADGETDPPTQKGDLGKLEDPDFKLKAPDLKAEGMKKGKSGKLLDQELK